MDNELKKAIKEKYNVIGFNSENPLSENDRRRFSKNYDMDQAIVNIRLTKSSQFTCFRSKEAENEYLGIKGFTGESGYEILNGYKEFHDVNDKGTGQIRIRSLDDKPILSANIQEGIFEIVKGDADPRTAPNQDPDTSLCQAQGNESVSGCYHREVDEFCDGFFGCAAIATSPGVHLLILGMCSCKK